MTHDFEKALTFIDNVEKQYGSRKEFPLIQLALRIADRLQKGVVSDRMISKVSNGQERWNVMAERDFKAMSQQLIKEECENEISTD